MGSDNAESGAPAPPQHPHCVTLLSEELTSFAAVRPLVFGGLSADYSLVPETGMVELTGTFHVPLQTGGVRAADIEAAKAVVEAPEPDAEPEESEDTEAE